MHMPVVEKVGVWKAVKVSCYAEHRTISSLDFGIPLSDVSVLYNDKR